MTGAARRDERARQLAARLCESPPFRRRAAGGRRGTANPRSETQLHAPGWVSSMARRDSEMHLSVDPKVARALYYAWRAREQLGCPPRLVAGWCACVRSVATSPFFRYPNIRLNQINFSAELQACAASMTEDPTLLRRDYRRQLRGSCAARSGPCGPGASRTWARATTSTAIPSSAPAPTEHRVGRVRQHRARRHLLLRAGAARGMTPISGRTRACCAHSCGARCRRTGRTAAT